MPPGSITGPGLQGADVYLWVHVLNMIFHLILPRKPLMTFILTSCRRAAELSRPRTMFRCMTVKVGKTAIGLLAVKTSIFSFSDRGWRLVENRIHGRKDWSCTEEIRVSRDDCTVSNLERSDEDRAMCYFQTEENCCHNCSCTHSYSGKHCCRN